MLPGVLLCLGVGVDRFDQGAAAETDLVVIVVGQGAADDPTGGVAHDDGQNGIRNEIGHHKQVQLAEEHKSNEHGGHGDLALAGAAQGVGVPD